MDWRHVGAFHLEQYTTVFGGTDEEIINVRVFHPPRGIPRCQNLIAFFNAMEFCDGMRVDSAYKTLSMSQLGEIDANVSIL